MDHVFEEYEKDGFRVRIIQDTDPMNPEEGDAPVYLAHFHRQFEHVSDDLPFASMEGMSAFLDGDWREDWAIFPVDSYIHGGIVLALVGSDEANSLPDRRWDVSRVGAILVRKDGGWGGSLYEVAEAHLKAWNQYLSGDVYGFVIDKASKCDCCGHVDHEDVESCWGFYGSEDCKSEANAVAEAAAGD